MANKQKPRRLHGIATFIIAMLLVSGGLRLSQAGIAVAQNSGVGVSPTGSSTHLDGSDAQLEALMNMLSEREKGLDAREEQLAERSAALKEAEAIIKANLTELETAEVKLAKTIAQVESASQQDVQRLTNVYETMKPKDAAQLFEQMSAEFAAGFLGEMSPTAAAGIMSALSAEKAYEVSVIIAGRNANTQKNSE